MAGWTCCGTPAADADVRAAPAALGRPGRLDVLVPAGSGGVQVRGTAVRIA